jgi:LmbE family N-acetylglucosaminyl deacetylase
MLVGHALAMLAQEDLLRRATAPEETSAPMPRAVVVVAHPDDETIAIGARMGRFHEAHFIHVTDGAPRNQWDSGAHGFAELADYRQARVHELVDMFSTAGLLRVSHRCLDVPDQEASFHLVEIAREVGQHLSHHQPEVIFTHPYEGGHPDHDACAFAVHHAVRLYDVHSGERAVVIETPFYHAEKQGFGAGVFLRSETSMPEIVYRLTPEEKERKHRLVARFTTQRETLKGFHDETERYRIAPAYDFMQPPHQGKLHYENYPWGMSSGRICELAREAEVALRDETKGAQ